jgi:hypothetical protein
LQKIAYILLVFLSLSGCASFKKAQKTGEVVKDRNSFTEAGIIANNLTGKGFFIQKALVQISSKDVNEKFLASIKFAMPDTFNISIRSRTGLEVARIFLTQDTVLVNDRLQRILYYGKPSALARKFGFNFDAIPLIFGDYISSGNKAVMNCINGESEISAVIHGLKIKYSIDCRRMKNSRIVQEGSFGKSLSEMEFDDYRKTDDISFPSLIKIKDTKTNSGISIKIDNVERPWIGNMRFVPGNRYDLIELR